MEFRLPGPIAKSNLQNWTDEYRLKRIVFTQKLRFSDNLPRAWWNEFAHDLQNLGDYEMRSEHDLFGSDAQGRPLVTLRNEPDKGAPPSSTNSTVAGARSR